MLLQQHCPAHGPSPPRLCLCPACAARTIAATGVGPWASRGALVGAGSPARVVELHPIRKGTGGCPIAPSPVAYPREGRGQAGSGGWDGSFLAGHTVAAAMP